MANPEVDPQEVQEGKIFAVLSYLSILCIIPLIFKKTNPFVLQHGKQGLVIFVAQAAAFIISIVMPWILKPVFFASGLLSLWGIIECLRGRSVRLPIVADIAEKITL